ncbi:hypothetical protein [Planococcus sp. ISL-109]|uniref:DUF7686 domain-containing protein n=1 Tax=Planococcus sp. ISL-109 TaxID=2819166 RepID=UPI001BEC336F|nr:hypothetical protein [Planococcus sp. ISL-109]MBT2583964.1 hypothetical protein [Planococcus sp. ISL-109]
MEICERCSRSDAYILLGTERICSACFNDEMEESLGVKATAYPEGMALRDQKGVMRSFRIRKRLLPVGIMMEADERKEQGFNFEVLDDLDCDQDQLLSKLLSKVQKGLAENYIVEDRLPSGHIYRRMDKDRLGGTVAWNGEDQETPLIIVDGEPYSWDQIGKILMSYEGFQLKLEIVDSSDEIRWDEEKEKDREN